MLFTQTIPASIRAATAYAVRRPDRASQAEARVIGSINHFVDVEVTHHGQHRTELLLANQSGSLGDVTDDGRLDEVARSLKHAAAGNDLSVLPGILQELLDFFELRLVLDQAHLRTLLQAVANDRASRPNSSQTASWIKSWTSSRLIAMHTWPALAMATA